VGVGVGVGRADPDNRYNRPISAKGKPGITGLSA
jgi:hypothetical protein